MQENWNSFLRNLPFGQHDGSVPSNLLNQMFEDLLTTSIFRKLAFIIQTSSQKLILPCDLDCKYGIEWSSEGQRRDNNSIGKWKRIEIPTFTLHSRITMTHELLDDSNVDIEEILYNRVIYKMSEKENEAFFYGKGDKEPIGLLNQENLKIEQFDKDGELNSFINAYMKLPNEFKTNAVWFVNRSFINYLSSLNKQSLFIQPPIHQKFLSVSKIRNSLINNSFLSFLNLPVFVVESLKEEDMAIIVDLKNAYCIVDRADISIFKDPYSNKPDIEFYFSKRLGGAPINSNALVIVKKN
jgi:HK97 family phage major capsid protein